MTEPTDAARLSKLLFDARELADMYAGILRARIDNGRSAPLPDGERSFPERVRDEIDAYRAERGWSPDGFGGEVT